MFLFDPYLKHYRFLSLNYAPWTTAQNASAVDFI